MQNIIRVFSPSDFPLFSDSNSAVEADSAADAMLFYKKSIPAKHIFLHADRLSREGILATQGQCRYLVNSADALLALDAALDGSLPAGYLEPVGLCIGPDGFPRDIPVLSASVRRTQNLTLRYAFLSLSNSPDPALAAREAFSFIKRLRADVPCMLHGFCFSGLQCNAELRETLDMLAALNDSSLYAEFFLA